MGNSETMRRKRRQNMGDKKNMIRNLGCEWERGTVILVTPPGGKLRRKSPLLHQRGKEKNGLYRREGEEIMRVTNSHLMVGSPFHEMRERKGGKDVLGGGGGGGGGGLTTISPLRVFYGGKGEEGRGT